MTAPPSPDHKVPQRRSIQAQIQSPAGRPHGPSPWAQALLQPAAAVSFTARVGRAGSPPLLDPGAEEAKVREATSCAPAVLARWAGGPRPRRLISSSRQRANEARWESPCGSKQFCVGRGRRERPVSPGTRLTPGRGGRGASLQRTRGPGPVLHRGCINRPDGGVRGNVTPTLRQELEALLHWR